MPMLATRGRASFLGERSIGHVDPGATLDLPADPCRLRRARGPRMTEIVGIVIVSHSPKVAEGAADMVRQMVGDEVPLRLDRRQPGGRARHRRRQRSALPIEQVWIAAGVAVFVDLGGAETNAEMAIEMLPPEQAAGCGSATRRSSRVRSSRATEASGGARLEAVCAARRGAGPDDAPLRTEVA